jgi:hypothetical protein
LDRQYSMLRMGEAAGLLLAHTMGCSCQDRIDPTSWSIARSGAARSDAPAVRGVAPNTTPAPVSGGDRKAPQERFEVARDEVHARYAPSRASLIFKVMIAPVGGGQLADIVPPS